MKSNMMKKRKLRFGICVEELIYQTYTNERKRQQRKKEERETQEKPIKNRHIRSFTNSKNSILGTGYYYFSFFDLFFELFLENPFL